MKIKCEECGNINKFHKDKNAEKVHSVGGDSFYIRLRDKDYICEKCGVELDF